MQIDGQFDAGLLDLKFKVEGRGEEADRMMVPVLQLECDKLSTERIFGVQFGALLFSHRASSGDLAFERIKPRAYFAPHKVELCGTSFVAKPELKKVHALKNTTEKVGIDFALSCPLSSDLVGKLARSYRQVVDVSIHPLQTEMFAS